GRKGIYNPPSRRETSPQLQTAATSLQSTGSSVPFEGDARRKGMFTTLLLSLLLLSSLLPAQNCLPILQDAQRAYNRGQLKQALTILQQAEICDIDNQIIQQRQRLQGRIFAAIEGQRKDLEAALAEAKATLEAKNKIISQIYFYQGKYGLTYKHLNPLSVYPKYRFGFIDPKGNELIPFQFETATPFLDDGFARVTMEGKKYLLDTLGRTFTLANTFEEANAQTQAIDLSGEWRWPEDLGAYLNVEILLSAVPEIEEGDTENFESFEKNPDTYSPGPIPASIGQCKKLRILQLAKCGLTELPAEIGQLDKLEQLILYGNDLTSLPESIGDLASLQVLYVSFNEIGRLPASFSKLESLEYLSLAFNQLTSLAEDIGSLRKLKSLDLAYNPLVALPSGLLRLPKLRQLSANNMALKSLPDLAGAFPSLERLDLNRNQLTSLPASIGQLPALRDLDLAKNFLISLPPEIGQLSTLSSLNLVGNLLTEIPESIGDLSQLGNLLLSDNKLSALPASLFQLENLVNLQLNQNQLTSLPSGIGKLDRLYNLELKENQLRQLPNSIKQLQQLRKLVLTGNRLEALPPELTRLSQLQTLLLGKNQLTKLPEDIARLRQLRTLMVSENRLQALPQGLCQMPGLNQRFSAYNLLLKDNQITEVPECLLDTFDPLSLWNLAFSGIGEGRLDQCLKAVELLRAKFPEEKLDPLWTELDAWETPEDQEVYEMKIRKLLRDE
ncbi:MAG: leucine-rich repeat domain-containing protein, partial [Bacteroidota bacterium]